MKHLRHENQDWYLESGKIVTRNGERITVCSERKPAIGCRPIMRKGPAEWLIAPLEYRGLTFRPVPDGDFILLTGSPDSVSTQLSELIA